MAASEMREQIVANSHVPVDIFWLDFDTKKKKSVRHQNYNNII